MKFEAMFNNKDPQISLDENIWEVPFKRIKEEKVDGFNLVLEKYDNDIYNYYAEQLESDDEHRAGYKWSSRVGVINKHFNTKLIDVIIGCAGYAMDIDDLAKILPDDYEIVKWKESWMGNEIYWKVVQK